MAARHQLEHDLTLVGLHGIKHVMDVPIRYVDRYVAAMPIHEKLRAKDAPTIHNYLKANLCNVHDVFVKRADIPALVGDSNWPRLMIGRGSAGGPMARFSNATPLIALDAFVIDTETTSLDPAKAQIVEIGVAVAEGRKAR